VCILYFLGCTSYISCLGISVLASPTKPRKIIITQTKSSVEVTEAICTKKSSVVVSEAGVSRVCSGRGSFHRKIQVKSSRDCHALSRFDTVRFNNQCTQWAEFSRRSAITVSPASSVSRLTLKVSHPRTTVQSVQAPIGTACDARSWRRTTGTFGMRTHGRERESLRGAECL
jgi:hypothetical protein